MARAGEYRHLFEIYQPAETGGDAVVTPVLKGRTWGSLEGLPGTNSGGLVADAGYRITMRFHPEVKPRRFVRDTATGRRFELHLPVDPEGRRRELVSFASELV